MKNAIVLVDHHGDDGTVRAGTILKDLSDQRFAALEKRGLIREAKAADTKSAPAPSNKAALKPANKGSN